MKILLVNTSDIKGGAARAANRLHQALLQEHINCQMLVQLKFSDDFTVLGVDSKIQKGMAILRSTMDALPLRFYKKRTQTLFSPAWVPFSGVPARINKLNPDLVHIHWACGGLIRLEDIARINAPVVWSLHDMWAFTGGCHYDEMCGAYKHHCGNCIVLNSDKSNDLSRKVHKRKQGSLQNHHNLTVIGLSKWLAKCASESSLFKNKTVVNLPNPIDVQIFSPLKKSIARDLLNLPQGKKLILFGAMNATSDKRKGFMELLAALAKIELENVELIIFGSSKPRNSQGFKYKVRYLGNLHDDLTLRVLYSAADVMVVPSIQENLSNAIMESLACGTPVAGFNIGGNADLIEHKKTGFLAKPYSELDLAKGIEWILTTSKYDELSSNARTKVLQEFDSRVVVKQYISLYKNILLSNIVNKS